MQTIEAQKALVAAFLVLSVSACGRLADSYEINPIVTGPDGVQVLKDGKQSFRLFDITTDSLPDGCNYTLAAGYTTTKAADGANVRAVASAADSQACRNRLMDHLLMLSDQRCAGHKAAIEANAAGSNFAFSSLTTLLGGAGAIVTGADAARALAGSAGAVSGVHANWNESIYQKNVATAIVAKIDDSRQAILEKMMTARANPQVVYSVDAMLADVYRYHDACSFYSGLMNLGKSATAPATADALRGRIASLRSQIKENTELAANSSGTLATSLEATNQALLKSINHLTIQLGVVESRSGVGVSAAEASPTPQSAQTSPTPQSGQTK